MTSIIFDPKPEEVVKAFRGLISAAEPYFGAEATLKALAEALEQEGHEQYVRGNYVRSGWFHRAAHELRSRVLDI